MKCVQLMESWLHGLHRHVPEVDSANLDTCQLSLSCGTDLLNSIQMKFSKVISEGKVDTPFAGMEEERHPSAANMQWCSLPALVPKHSPTHSPAWGHLKMELDLQAMMEEDSAPKCRRDLFLAFTNSAANEARVAGEHHSAPVRVDITPCDSDSLYDETSEMASSSLPKAEDRNLARLIAKFDSSIEALWNPEDTTEIPEEFRDDDSDDHLTASPVPMDLHGSKQNLFIACGTNITSSIWSTQPSPEDPLRDEWSLPMNVKWSEGDANPCCDSLIALNHNREDSSFTEVIPRSLHTSRELLPQMPQPPPPPPAAAVQPESGKEEEDLLTSARTHFIPIRQEPPARQQHQSTSYADGTTFVIPTSLERIAFKRSESGALYLEEEVGLDSPRKYMEFKEKDSNECKAPEDFVPKFRVSQNEKCCQTEQDECMEEDSSGQKSFCVVNEFYFPGDEQLSLEEDEEEEDEIRLAVEAKMAKRCGKCAGEAWMPPGWPTEWQEVQPSPQSWYQIWSESNASQNSSGGCWDCSQPSESHKSQLRRELSEDGEQLLSDLSSLLNQYGGVLSEINGNKRDHSEKMAEYTINYKIKKAGPMCGKQDSDWITNERTIRHGTAQKERKRRYSSSQRACSLFLEGSCRRPHCRFSHDMASIPCHFWADASCLKGGKCPFLHGGRPVTL